MSSFIDTNFNKKTMKIQRMVRIDKIITKNDGSSLVLSDNKDDVSQRPDSHTYLCLNYYDEYFIM